MPTTTSHDVITQHIREQLARSLRVPTTDERTDLNDLVRQTDANPLILLHASGIRPSAMIDDITDEQVKAAGGHDSLNDTNDKYLQLLVPIAIDTYAELLLNPDADPKLRKSVADMVLEKRSYTGIRRIAIAQRLSLDDDTIERLQRASDVVGGVGMGGPTVAGGVGMGMGGDGVGGAIVNTFQLNDTIDHE